VPLAGKLCDMLTRRGVSRTTVSLGWLSMALVLLQILAMGGGGVAALAMLGFLLGVSLNLFPLISAAVSETYGPEKTASVIAFVNMIAQLAGATMLAVSGYVGLALTATPGNAVAEYRGIWLSAMVSVGILTVLGGLTQLALARGWTSPRIVAVTPH
jgi:MFS family permease